MIFLCIQNPGSNIWQFTVFQYRIDWPQVKQDLIFSITDFLCKLCHELLKNLRLMNLGEQEILGKPQNSIGIGTRYPDCSGEINFWLQQSKITLKHVEVFHSCLILPDFCIFCQVLCPWWQVMFCCVYNWYTTGIQLEVSDHLHSSVLHCLLKTFFRFWEGQLVIASTINLQ